MSLPIAVEPIQNPARDRILITLLAICTFAIYYPSRHYQFIGYDDQLYVYENLHVLRGLSIETIKWALSTKTIIAANWHPVTMLADILIATFWGPNPAAFHMISTLLHVLNVVLLFFFVRSATGRSWAALFTAALWALHPLRVESVVWISELKDVLCGAFWLGAMLAYLGYVRRRTFAGWSIVLLLGAMALLAKPMAVTLPAALLLLDFWPLNNRKADAPLIRWWTVRIAEKLPLLALCIADILYAVSTQTSLVHSGSSPVFPIGLRLQNAIASYVFYLRDIFFPRNLQIFYPNPAMLMQTIPLSLTILAAVFLLVITVLTIFRARTQPYLAFGWFWFLGTMIPVIGLVRIGELARADRYTYLPSIGITIAVVFLVCDWADRRKLLPIVALAGSGAAIALAICTSLNLPNWQSTHTLFAHALSVQPNNYLALRMESGDALSHGDDARAIQLAIRAVEIAPRSDGAHISYALALKATHHLPEAWTEFRTALSINKTSPDAWIGIGAVCNDQALQRLERHEPTPEIKKKREEAALYFSNALLFDPDSIEARELLAVDLAALGKIDDAIDQWQDLLSRLPTYSQAQGDLADALLLKGDIPDAVQHFRLAIANGAKDPLWETKLAWFEGTDPLNTPAQVQQFVGIAKDACAQTSDQDADALDAYAACLARVGIFDLAIETAQKAMVRADAAKNPTLSKDIQKRLALYQQFKPFVHSDEEKTPATMPATTRSAS